MKNDLAVMLKGRPLLEARAAPPTLLVREAADVLSSDWLRILLKSILTLYMFLSLFSYFLDFDL